MDTSELANSMDSRSVCPLKNKSQPGAEANRASQELVISSNDEFQWCAEMDYQFAWSNQSQKGIYENSISEISFTSNSDSSVSNGRYKNFDIHLAQIDIETFKSEDIERLTHNSVNGPMEDSTDTLRIVESLRSLNVANDTSKYLQPPNDDCEAISVDSLDLSIDNEISAKLIQKCSERDKTRYKIAMIDTSAHSQLQSSTISTNSDFDYGAHVNNNYLNKLPNGSNLQLNLELSGNRVKSKPVCNNPFVSSTRHYDTTDSANVDILQSPGSLVQMFIQNKISSNENSVLENLINNGNYLNENLSKCDINNCNNVFVRQQSQVGEPIANYAIDEMEESTGNSLNTVDSNELPLHVLDLSKKLRSMNLAKQMRYGSTSMSSNTSYTSTTTSSSATTFDKRKQSHYSTNPFLQMNDREDKKTRTTSTQFPELFQDKEVQASFEEEECKEAPVLVYYPNYSLPDLSFLQDIFKQEKSKQPIYLSPVKHEPPKMSAHTSMVSEVNRRVPNNSSQRKSRPKSYADYETLLSQDFSHIKDWDSLNLLLPDDFKEFIEKNNLLNCRTPSNSSHYSSDQFGHNRSYPIKATIPNSRALQSVKLRSQRHQQPSTKRYSLQEANYDPNSFHYPYYQTEMESNLANSSMTRSQTMPNCRPPQQNPHSHLPYYPPANSNYYHNCCHPCCHSNCHSPSFHSSQSSPQKPNANFNWEMLSSSSFKKLISFLSKLDECSDDHSESSKADTQKNAKFSVNSIIDQKNSNAISKTPKNSRTIEQKGFNIHEPVRERTAMKTPSKLDLKPKVPSSMNKTMANNKANSHSKATSPMSTNRDVLNRRTSNAPEKTKIILKRPTTLKSGTSGIPVPKRTSSKSMIPIPKNTPLKDYTTKDRFKSGANMRF